LVLESSMLSRFDGPPHPPPALWAAALGVALALLCRPVLAETPDTTKQAQTLFQRAELNFSRGEFGEALRLYLEAHRVKPLPELLFNVGQCHRRLGDCEKAVFYFEQFLLQKPRAQRRSQVQALVDECRATLQRQRRGEGEVPCSDCAGARPGRAARVLFWSTVGLAGALVVTGAITGGLAHREDDEYTSPRTSVTRRQQISESRQRLENASWATLGIAAAAGASAALICWLSRPGADPRPRVSIAPLSTSGGAVLLGGQF
jgi:tetratricopeptide (TPR) repeat protein